MAHCRLVPAGRAAPDRPGGLGALPGPLPTLLALALPGGTLSLSIVTCVFSSVILGYVASRLRRRVSAVAVVALLLPIVAVPTMWYAESQFLGPVCALAFLAIALRGVRPVHRAR